MSNFDVGRAGAGEPVERIYGAGWQSVEFIAQWNDCEAVCRVPDYGFPELIKFECLRMAPKKVKVRYRVALIKGQSGIEACSLTEKVRWQLTPEKFEDQDYFLKWIDADWREVEI